MTKEEIEEIKKRCPHCQGTGLHTIDGFCWFCNGTGKREMVKCAYGKCDK